MPSRSLVQLSRTVLSPVRLSYASISINHAPRNLAPRPLSTTSRLRADRNPNPQRDAQQDRTKMDPSANEYTKSGTDNTAAGNEEAAFDPNITDPQEAKDKAGEGNQVNPLDASPANPEISQPTAEEEGGAKKKISEGGGGR